MRIKFTKHVQQELEEALAISLINSEIQRTLMHFLWTHEVLLCSDKSLDIDTSMDAVTDGFVELFYASGLADAVVPPELLARMVGDARIIRIDKIKKEPFVKNVLMREQEIGNIKYEETAFQKFEVECLGFGIMDGIHFPLMGILDQDYTCKTLFENGKPWMKLAPSELITMESDIKAAHNNVLMLGCGIGYYAYACLYAGKVSHVTIIEKDPRIIELFKEIVLPGFGEFKDKVSVIQADAFDYLATLKGDEYDFCYADLWQDNQDVIPYLKCLFFEKKLPDIQFRYWIENNVVDYILTNLIAEMLREAFDEDVQVLDLKTKIQMHGKNKLDAELEYAYTQSLSDSLTIRKSADI